MLLCLGVGGKGVQGVVLKELRVAGGHFAAEYCSGGVSEHPLMTLTKAAGLFCLPACLLGSFLSSVMLPYVPSTHTALNPPPCVGCLALPLQGFRCWWSERQQGGDCCRLDAQAHRHSYLLSGGAHTGGKQSARICTAQSQVSLFREVPTTALTIG
jgi:hypothetical protein